MAALAPSAARMRWAAMVWQGAASPSISPLRLSQRPRPQAAEAAAMTAAAGAVAAAFSTSPALSKRRRYHPRDNNPLRGVSSMRRSGPREFLSVSDDRLPRPVESVKAAAKPEIDPEHGLWQFFYDRQVAQPPTKDTAFGRAWTVEELRRKSWDDLHRLWWVCVKERNRIATAAVARKQFDLGFGQYESEERDGAVKQTMRGIKHVLTERFYTWEDAVDLAQSDPEIDLSGEGPAFRPAAYLEEELPGDNSEEASRTAGAQAEVPTETGQQQAPLR